MRSRVVREGAVGLLLLLGLGVTLGIIAWLRGAHLGGQYSLAIELADAIGLDAGSPVKYRGVKVGRVRSLTPSVNGVTAQVEIAPASLVIPRNSTVTVTQSGFIGQVELSIQPERSLSKMASASDLSPFKPNCSASSVVLCDGDRLSGTTGASFDELIRSTTKLTALLSDSKLIDNANRTLKTFNNTALSINQLSRSANITLKDVSTAANQFSSLSGDARQQLQAFGPAARSVTRAADQVGQIGGQIGSQFGGTATRITAAADQVTALVQDNRTTLVTTLGNLQTASKDLKTVLKDLSPIISRVENSKILDNLETLADNGAKASANLKSLTTTLNNPVTLLGLAQTLDSARVTFQNTQKITTDLEQVTGNPQLRQNLIRLINGLSKLVSSTQTLDQQMAAVQQGAIVIPTAGRLPSLLTAPESGQASFAPYFQQLSAPVQMPSNLFSVEPATPPSVP